MMSKEQFTKELVNELTERLGENYSVHSQTVTKNNGVKLDAVVIRKEQQNVCPTIYIDSYFQEYCNGQKNLSCIASEIINVYEHSTYSDDDFFNELHKKPLNIKCKLINTEINTMLLDTVPHKEWNDLSIVYFLELGADDYGKRTVTITNWLMEVLGLNVEELDRLATENMEQNFNPCIESMSTVIHRLLGMDDMLDSAEDNDRMYVISNEEKVNGAISILHKDILKNFATQKNIEKIWILPSSIHEMILVLDDGTMCADTFNHMVQEVNETEVDSLEVLSSQCYIYNRLTDSISVA